jgi:hypothetical protein
MSIAEIKTPDLATESVVTSSEINLKLIGSAETDAMKTLDTYLKSVHAIAVPDRVPVVVDLRALEFMNSSCFKSFVTWIRLLQDLPTDNQYKVRFLSDSKKHWQSRSLGALACFAVDLIHIETS